MRVNKPAFATGRPVQGVVSVSKGGTGAQTPAQAVANLGGIYVPNLDLANSVAKLTSSGKVNPDHLPAAFARGPTLKGSLQLYPTQVATYTITNYDSSSVYTATVTAGRVYRTLDTLTLVAPSAATTMVLSINGRDIPIVVQEPWPLKPTIAASTSGTTTSATGIFTGSAFAMIAGNATHRRTDWQIAYDANFTNFVLTSENDHSHLTALEVQNLAMVTSYYVRARYEGSNGILSDWSDGTLFTTLDNYTPNGEEAKLIASDKAANDAFGQAVAIDDTGTRVVVGCPNDDGTLSANVGSVYIFLRTGTTWAQEAHLIQSSVLELSIFAGFSVAIDATGTRVVAGAYGLTTSQGGCYIYIRSGTTWTLETTLKASDATNSDRLGYSVSCDSTCTWVAAGTPQRKVSTATNAGSVVLFHRTGTTWSASIRITTSDFAGSDFFGWSVAINGNGDRLIAGAYLADPSSTTGAGAAYVFTRSGTSWTQEAKLVASDRVANFQFGYSVSMNQDGSRVIVGANNATTDIYLNAGAAYIFQRTGVTWVQSARLNPYDHGSGDQFGSSVSMNNLGDKVMVGAMTADPGGTTTAGETYVFTLTKGLWNLDAKLIASDKAASDNYGGSVSISGEGGRGVVGANAEDPGNTNNAGCAYVYS